MQQYCLYVHQSKVSILGFTYWVCEICGSSDVISNHIDSNDTNLKTNNDIQ